MPPTAPKPTCRVGPQRNGPVAGRSQTGIVRNHHRTDVVTQILKVFYEEPAALESDAFVWPAPPDTPRYYRLYLAGTDLDTLRIGLTALRSDAFLPALLSLLQRWPHRCR